MLCENTEGSLHEKCSKIIKSITELPFVDCGVPRALLTAIIESNKSSIKALSLRALATVCVNGDAVKQFEEVSLICHTSIFRSERRNHSVIIKFLTNVELFDLIKSCHCTLVLRSTTSFKERLYLVTRRNLYKSHCHTDACSNRTISYSSFT